MSLVVSCLKTENLNQNLKLELDQKISILGCGWLGMPLASSFVQKGFVIKGSTASNDKLKKLKSEGVIPYLIMLNNLENNISIFLKKSNFNHFYSMFESHFSMVPKAAKVVFGYNRSLQYTI